MKVISMLVGMYMITFCLFLIETGCVHTALTMGLVAASLKSAFSLAHGHYWGKVV